MSGFVLPYFKRQLSINMFRNQPSDPVDVVTPVPLQIHTYIQALRVLFWRL